MGAEERASRISPEKNELDEAIENIMERMEGAEEEIAQRAESTAVVMEKEGRLQKVYEKGPWKG